MRPQVPLHPDDDRLLELAYGEVPASEARALRQHVDGCARCRKVLEGIAEVRTAFRSVPNDPAPGRGLESLLAYGEQAAARARSRRGGLRILALLSAATAFAVVWLVVPASSRHPQDLARAPASGATDVLAQAEVPPPAAQGDRARDEADRAKDLKENEKKAPAAAAPVAPLAKAERPVDPLPKQKGPEKLDALAEQRKVAEAPALRPSDHEVGDRAAAGSSRSGEVGIAGAAGGKAGAVSGTSPTAGAGTLGTESIAAVAKKHTAGGRIDDGDGRAAASRQPPATPPAAVAVATPPAGRPRAEEVRAQEAAKVAAAPVAELVASEDKAAAASAPARNAAKPAPPVQSMRIGAGSPEKLARIAEIERQLKTAKGDQRKALLMERCELDASLQNGPEAVLSCSRVTQEFPGTPEAKRAGEIARGFSLQPPPAEER